MFQQQIGCFFAVFIINFPGFVFGQSIITKPLDTTGQLGKEAKFVCKIQFGIMEFMTWEFNQNLVYSHFEGVEFLSKKDKYSVQKMDSVFTLHLKNLTFSDGGMYTCAMAKGQASAALIVLDEPYISSDPPNPVEGRIATFTCNAQFGGPAKTEITPDIYPHFSMFINSTLTNGTVKEIHPQGSVDYYHLSQEYSITVNPNLHGLPLACEIKTENPKLILNKSSTANVSYAVRNVDYRPKYENYQVGKFINCTADSNPLSSFEWKRIADSKSLPSSLLEITEDMAGRNAWICIAENVINGELHLKSINVTFYVEDSAQPKNESWKIAVGVIVPISFLIATVLIVYKVWRNKSGVKYKPPPDDPQIREECIKPTEDKRENSSEKIEAMPLTASGTPNQNNDDSNGEVDEQFKTINTVDNAFDKIKQFLQKFEVDDDICKEITTKFQREILDGLSQKDNTSPGLKCFPTSFITLPGGSEVGEFLVLIVHPKEVVVSFVILKGSNFKPEERYCKSYEGARCTSGEFFDDIAKFLEEFLKCFSLQEKLKLAVLMNRTIINRVGFKDKNKDPLELLQTAVSKKYLRIQCVLHYGTAAADLLSLAHTDNNCRIGVLLDSESEIYYVENVPQHIFNTLKNKQVLMNVYWRGYHSGQKNLDQITDIDNITKEDYVPNFNKFEKMIAGRHLGEIVRQCLVKAISLNYIFGGLITEEIKRAKAINSTYVETIMKDDQVEHYENTRRVLHDLGYSNLKEDDCKFAHYICGIVVQRAAHLVSCGIAAVINHLAKPTVTVAVTGSLYSNIPTFHRLMEEKIAVLIKPECKFQLMSSEGTLPKGGALLLALTKKFQLTPYNENWKTGGALMAEGANDKPKQSK